MSLFLVQIKLVLTKVHKFQRKKYLVHVKDWIEIELKELNVWIDYDVIGALTLIQTYRQEKQRHKVLIATVCKHPEC